jgi:acetylglutamate kinase
MAALPTPPEVLLRAAARARQLRGRPLVVKLGGSAMEDPAATRGTLEAVVALQTLGVRLVLVHGGGKPIDRAMAAAGLEPKKVAGRRYTDEATLEIVVRVLGEINAGLVEQIRALGGAAEPYVPAGMTGERMTLTGPDGQPIDLGRVGRVTSVSPDVYGETFDRGEVAVVPSLAYEQVAVVPPLPRLVEWVPPLLNVNADTAAAAVAGALKAEACYFLTDTPGVLWDVTDPASLLPRLTRSECERLIRDGVIAGGMLPKVEACFEALDAGAGRAVILDGRDPYALLGEFVSANPTGTEIVP